MQKSDEIILLFLSTLADVLGLGVHQHHMKIITHARIDESVTTIEKHAFSYCFNLLDVDFHSEVDIVERNAFIDCRCLRRINLPGVRIIGVRAFQHCDDLEDVEFGNKLEIIGESAFMSRKSLRDIKIPSVMTIEVGAFLKCKCLTDAEFGIYRAGIYRADGIR